LTKVADRESVMLRVYVRMYVRAHDLRAFT
jgi:hypothetical protein